MEEEDWQETKGGEGEASKKGTDPVLVLPTEHGSENP